MHIRGVTRRIRHERVVTEAWHAMRGSGAGGLVPFVSFTSVQWLCANPQHINSSLRHYHPAVKCKNGTYEDFTQALPSSSWVQERSMWRYSQRDTIHAVVCSTWLWANMLRHFPSWSVLQKCMLSYFYSANTFKKFRPTPPKLSTWLRRSQQSYACETG